VESKKPRAPRLSTELAGSLAGRAERRVTVTDVSITGCLARVDTKLDRGAVQDLSLELPSGPVRVKVLVAESSVEGESLAGGQTSFLVGLKFLGLAPAETARLSRYIAERRRRGGSLPPAP
jgi:c-di-GMP-binding flagellar brake protein YcgR